MYCTAAISSGAVSLSGNTFKNNKCTAPTQYNCKANGFCKMVNNKCQ